MVKVDATYEYLDGVHNKQTPIPVKRFFFISFCKFKEKSNSDETEK